VKIIVSKGKLTDIATEAAVVTHFEGEAALCGASATLDEKSGRLVSEIISQGDFTGRLHQISVIYSRGSLPAKTAGSRGSGEEGGFFC